MALLGLRFGSTMAALALWGLTACGGGDTADGPTDEEVRATLGPGLAELLVELGTAGPLEAADCTLEGEIVRGEPRDTFVDTLAETKMTYPVQVASVCTGTRVTGEVEEVERRDSGSWTYLFYRDQFDQWAWKAEAH